MADVRPFRALRPRGAVAAKVIAPPYDVLSYQEACAIAQNRQSFVRVTRSEVDLPKGADAHGEAAYRMAKQNLDAMISAAVLQLDDREGYLLYGQTMGDHTQVGVLAACSVDEYDRGVIAKHEFTRPDKEDDRTHHMEVLDAQVGLVFLTHRPHAGLSQLVSVISSAAPEWEVTTEDGVVHRLWGVPADHADGFQAAFAEMPTLYIADGHHRSAAASRVHASRGSEESAYFLAGLYPSDALQVMAYNRVVHDLNGRSPEAFLDAISASWDVTADTTDTPSERGDVRMYLQGQWFGLRIKPGRLADDVVAQLDCSALQDHLLAPILGVQDPRRSTRIHFVGGVHGPARLVRDVKAGAAVAFHMYPTGLDQLFDVADAGRVMPPKSTWFEPKLREGVAVRML